MRLYAFLAQVIPYTDRDLEIRYAFGRRLLAYLDGPSRENYDFTGTVELEYLARPKERESGAIDLDAGQEGEMKPPTDVGTTRPKDDDRTWLTEIIEHLNERFGTDFKPHDRLFIHHAVQAAKASETVVAQVRANTHEQFSLAASPRIQDWMIDGIDAHQELATRYLDAKKGVSAGKAFWGWQAYPRCNGTVG